MNYTIVKTIIIYSLFFVNKLANSQPTNPLLNDAYYNNSIVGNIYFPVKFVDGKFSQWKGKSAEGKLRFNLKTGQPEKLEGEKIMRLNSITTSFSMQVDDNKPIFNFRKGFKPIGVNDAETFYLILFDGKLKFLSQLRVFETLSTDYENPGQMLYTPVITYFLVNEKDEIFKLPSKKSIIKLPEINTQKTKAFMKKNSIKLDEWTDVQKVIEFNNGLLN